MDGQIRLPRQRKRHTGERLQEAKLTSVETLLLGGAKIARIAKTLGVSRNSVRGVARRLRESGYVAPERVAQIKEGLTARFALIADQSLTALNEDKLGKATALELVKIADLASQRAGLVDYPQRLVLNFLTQYNVRPSHSASRPTLGMSTLSESSDIPKAF